MGFLDECGNPCISPVLLLAAKPVRPGQYRLCPPINHFFIRGYSENTIAFCNAGFQNKNNPAAASVDAPPTHDTEATLPKVECNQNSSAELLDPQSDDDCDAQNNM